MSKNYYETLGIQKNANKEEIKKAFRLLAHKCHPDKKGGDEKRFKEINEAYTILSDDKKKAEYDAYGRVFNESGAGSQGNAQDFGGFDFSGFTNAQGFGNQEGFEFDLGDLFGDFFGGGRRETARGRDISIDLELLFEESIFGTERKVLLTKNSQCEHCKGTGGEPKTEMITCSACNGKGKIHETRRSIMGSFATVKTCDTCHGKGKVPKERCHVCRGNGIVNKQEEISIKIPAGINEGEMIRMPGAGEATIAGNSGDLYIKIHVKKHAIFAKDGSNLITDLNIKLSTALLGGEYSLATLDGPLSVKIPEGVSHGEILRVRGRGVPIDKSRRGDILITLHIDFPKRLSKEGRKLVEELKREGI
jgi:molecular chaperone DnaJ